MRRRVLVPLLVALASASGCAGGELDAVPSARERNGGGGFAGGVATHLDAAPPEPKQYTPIRATVKSTRFVTREHFLASGEMQISGEPLAEAMGRVLASYSRDFLPSNLYFDKSPSAQGPWIDVPGYSSAVESYEYSKQPMNGAAFEYGAGTSFLYGPLVNPSGASGEAAVALASGLVQKFAAGSNALGRFVFPPGTYPAMNASGNQNPTGAGDPAKNPLGWPGIWPTTHLFRSFDPAVKPSGTFDLSCAVTSDDSPGSKGALVCADYECDASSLHLVDRTAQIEAIVTPGADGFSAWKYGLWVLNYLQAMHDPLGIAVASVDDADLANVGAPGNDVIGADDGGDPTMPGTFLGSSDVEGFQAQLFIQQVDDRAEDWLLHLSTSDGASLSGFSGLASALAYDHAAPLRWFPSVAVTETSDGSGFPRPGYAVASPDSELLDQLGLAMGYSEFYALTDRGNPDVGGSQPALVFFDGDPFAADDQLANGEPTLHDRALAILRVTLVNLDRLHVDPESGILVDHVAMSGASPTRGATASTVGAAYAILGLRTALRAVSSQLQLYSNNVPDTAIGTTVLDAAPLHLPDGTTSPFAARYSAMLRREAALLLNHLTDPKGRAYAGWDVQAGAPTDAGDSLDAHTAAIRGLFGAFLATGDTRYRERALLVASRMDAVFYDAEAGLYGATPAPVTSVEYTPLRFALLQSSLRDRYQLVAARPGGEVSIPYLEARIGRLNKLVLNGWNDRNRNRLVDYPDECVNVVAGLPRGGLQMAERTLSGEIGCFEEKLAPGQARTLTADREKDCVPETDDAALPAALAETVVFEVMR